MSATLTLLNVLGAVALLLWGLRMVRTAAERALGRDLDRHLRRVAGSRLRAVLFGGVGAATLQSSTALVLLGAGFVARARLSLAAGLALALGADVGTAVAAQILSLDIYEIIPVLLLAGYGMFQWGGSKRWRHAGRAALGLGLILTALSLIVEATSGLGDSQTIAVLLGALGDDPVLAVLLAALVTWLVHSSLAVVLMIASLATAGTIAGPAVLYLVLGANLGAALPALTASLAEPMAARRVPAGNLLFRGLGVLCLAAAAGWFHDLLAAQGASPRAVAVLGHLAFNLALVLAALPFTGAVARLLERLMPGAPEIERPRAAPRHLADSALAEPRLALGNARREAVRLAELVQEMLDESEAALAPDCTPERLAAIGRAEEDVDALNNAIKFYMTELTRARLDQEESRQAHVVIAFATNMEHIADVVERDIRHAAERKRRDGLAFSEEGRAEIADLYARVREAMRLAVSAFMADDEDLAEQLIADKRSFRDEEQAANQRHLERLRAGNAASIDTTAIHLDLLRGLKRVHSHLTAIAYAMSDRRAGDLSDEG